MSEAMKASHGRHRRRSLDDRMMDLFGTDWCGGNAPPMTNRTLYVADHGVHRVFSTWDDGGSIGIGYPDEWQMHMTTKVARYLAVWTLWIWACDWFGLRSAIYYRALHHKVRGSWRRQRRRSKGDVHISSHDEWHAEQMATSRAARMRAEADAKEAGEPT